MLIRPPAAKFHKVSTYLMILLYDKSAKLYWGGISDRQIRIAHFAITIA